MAAGWIEFSASWHLVDRFLTMRMTMKTLKSERKDRGRATSNVIKIKIAPKTIKIQSQVFYYYRLFLVNLSGFLTPYYHFVTWKGLISFKRALLLIMADSTSRGGGNSANNSGSCLKKTETILFNDTSYNYCRRYVISFHRLSER